MSRSLAILVGIVVLVTVGDVALADGWVKVQDPTNFRYNWSGGEFTVVWDSGGKVGFFDSGVVANPSYAKSFETFCLERTEYFYWDTRYYGVISDNAVKGGDGASLAQNLDGIPFLKKVNGVWTAFTADNLSATTKALYYLFRTAQLDGFQYTGGSGRKEDSMELQKAIWALEQENGYKDYTNEWTKYFDTHVMPTADKLGQVKVLTMWSAAPQLTYGSTTISGVTYTQWYDVGGLTFIQDQLTLVPLPVAVVAGLGLLGGIGFARQMRRRRNRLL